MFEFVLVGIFVALLWIGWELHSIRRLTIEFLSVFAETYAEFVRFKSKP